MAEEHIYCEQCGDCTNCYAEERCFFGGDHVPESAEHKPCRKPEYGIIAERFERASLFRDGDFIWRGDIPAVQLCSLLGTLGIPVMICDHCLYEKANGPPRARKKTRK
jgi:hypothetical protein